MKAVNLIPADAAKRGRTKVAIPSGGPIGAYAVIAVLAVAVVMAGAWSLTGRQLGDKRNELTRVERDAQAMEAKVASLKTYTEFAALRKARVETVSGLLDGRFDWAHSLRELARVVESDVSLVSVVGTVSPSSAVPGGGGGGATLRTALPVPALDLIGCAPTQADVARLLARLRAIDGVDRVSLASSEKGDKVAASDSDCRSDDNIPQFQLTVFYSEQEGIVPAVDATAAPSSTPAAAAATTTAPAGGAK